MSGDIETQIVPPHADEDGDGDSRSARIMCTVIDSGEVSYEAATQLFQNADDPALFADSLLRVALAVAQLRGPDFAWAVMARFSAYDGMPS